jgi:hypothetical protein
MLLGAFWASTGIADNKISHAKNFILIIFPSLSTPRRVGHLNKEV